MRLSPFRRVVLIFMNAFSFLLLALQMRRDPWGDELWTYYFSESPNTLVNRVAGDPHPVGFYSIATGSNQLVSALLPNPTFWDIWPYVKLAAFLVSIVIFLILTTISIWPEMKLDKQKAWIFATALPSMTIFSATFGVATDFRSYGAQSIGAVLIAGSIWINMRRKNMTTGQLVAFVLSVALLGSLDVWASILSVFFLSASLLIWGQRKKMIVLTIAIWTPIISTTYLLGPLSGTREFDSGFGELSDWILGLGAGFSFQIWFAIPLFGIWLYYLVSSKRVEFLAFELPALATVGSAFIFSVFLIPIFKWYVLAPVFALLAAATLWRIATHEANFGFRALAVICILLASSISTALNPLNVVSQDAIWTSRGALENKQNWRETSSFVESRFAFDKTAIVLTDSQEFDAFLMPSVRTHSLSEPSLVCKKSSDLERVIIMTNASSLNEQKSLAEKYRLTSLRIWPTGGVYSYSCG